MKSAPAAQRLVLIVAMVAFFQPGHRWRAAAVDNETARANISAGYHLNSLRGYGGKVGEYDALDDGAEALFTVAGTKRGAAFNLAADLQDRDDQMYRLTFSAGDGLQSSFSYSRFLHRLDHHPLNNQDSVTDPDAVRSNVSTVEDITMKNQMRLPGLPFVRLLADWRSYSKRGHRQATTVTGCTQCHVSSANRRVDSQLQDISVGVQANIGPAAVSYAHLWRSLREHGDTPTTAYREDNSFYPSRGNLPFGKTPDSQAREHNMQVRTALPFASRFTSSIRWGELKNRDTRHDIAFNSFSGIITNSIHRHVSGNAFYARSRSHNKAPQGINRVRERGGFSLAARPVKQGSLNLTCQWETTDRRNFEVRSTDKRLCRLSYRQRFLSSIQIYCMYETTRTNDQFLRRDPRFPRLVKTALPDYEDAVQASATWELAGRLSLSTSMRCLSSDYSDYHVDEDRREYCLTAWLTPLKGLSLTAALTLMDIDIETPASLSAYHYGSRTALLFTDSIPYDSRAVMYHASAQYQLSPRIFLSGQLISVSSNAGFDMHIEKEDIGALSDVRVRSVEYSLGITYQHSPRLSFYTKYRFRKYDDQKASCLDGKFDFISWGLTWSG